jgi:hypothetical protein
VNTLKNVGAPLNVGKISIPWGVRSVSRMTPLFAVNTARTLEGLCNVPQRSPYPWTYFQSIPT